MKGFAGSKYQEPSHSPLFDDVFYRGIEAFFLIHPDYIVFAMRKNGIYRIVGTLGGLSLFLLCGLQAQNAQQKDSLLTVWEDESLEDTTRLRALEQVGDYFFFSNLNPDSLRYYYGLMDEFASKKQNLYYKALAQYNLGITLNKQGAFASAEPYFQESFRISEQLKDTFSMAKTYNSLGNMYLRMGDPEKAIESLEQSNTLFTQMGDSVLGGLTLLNIADINNSIGNVEKALMLTQQCLAIFQRFEQDRHIANARYNLGIIYMKMGDYSRAIHYFETIRRENNREGTLHLYLKSLGQLAELNESFEEYEVAEEYLNEAYHLSDSLKLYLDKAITLSRLGSLAHNQEKPQEARSYYEEAISLTREMGNDWLLLELEINMASIQVSLGDLELAESRLHRMVEDTKGIEEEIPRVLADIHRFLGDIYVERGQYSTARQSYQKGYAYAEACSNAEIQMMIASLLAEVNHELGYSDQAYDMLSTAVGLQDSLYEEENARALIRQEFQFTYEQQAYEDSLQNATTLAIQREENRRRKTVSNLSLIGLGITLVFGLVLFNRFRVIRRKNTIIQEEKVKLDLAYSDLNTANEKLRELDNFKSRFFTNISHEFRTPLTVITGMTQQVQQQPEKWLDKGLKLIDRNAQSLLHLINQILDLRKLESGNLSLHPVQADVIHALRLSVASFESMAESKDIELEFMAEEAELAMDFDPEKLGQIANNLLSNAIKFTPEGGNIGLRVISQAGSQLVIEVQDTGLGIPPDKLPYIFDRFYQVDGTDTRQGEGTGVGLSLTKELVQLMSLGQLAELNESFEEYEVAEEYLNEAYHLSDSLKLYLDKAITLSRLGSLAHNQEKPQEARSYYEEAISLTREMGNDWLLLELEINMASIQVSLGDLELAESRLHRMVEDTKGIEEEIPRVLADIHRFLGDIYVERGQYSTARQSYQKGYAYAEACSNAEIQMMIASLLAEVNHELGYSDQAYDMLSTAVGLQDSLYEEENARALIRQEFQFTYEQQAYEDSLQNATTLAIQREENRRRKTVSNLSLIGLGITLVFGLVLFNRFRVIRRKNTIIQEEKVKLDLAYSDLNTANEKLRELDNFKSRFFTNISHEFRTPLTVITGMTQQVQQQPEKWLDKGLKLIDRNAQSLLHLINQILDLRKLESGNLSLHPVQADVIHALRLSVASFESMAESKDIELEFMAEEAELAMDFDPEKLGQIANNLLSNAIKFTPEGGNIGLRVISQAGSQLVIEVQDTGLGIPPDKLPYIFDRFYQVDGTDTRQGEGTGVGLSLTKELVQLMNGEISVESQEKKGTRFRIALPIQQKAELSEASATVIPVNQLIPEALPTLVSSETELPRLLIIEDNPDIVSYLYSLLEDQYELSSAPDGQAGIELALEQVPDLIITDVMMPYKNGYEVTEALKLDERTSHIPIVMLTAKADQDSKLEGYQRGADAFLAKPFDQEELRVRLAKLWEIRQRLQSRYQSQVDFPATEDPTEIAEDAFLVKVRSVILAHVDETDYRRDALCEDLGLSKSNLNRKLKALTGLSTGNFIRGVRVAYAKELLMSEPELQVSEVAYASGFNDPAYFSRVFSEEQGLSPIEWREKRVASK